MLFTTEFDEVERASFMKYDSRRVHDASTFVSRRSIFITSLTCALTALVGSSLHDHLVEEDQRVTWLQRERPVLDIKKWMQSSISSTEWQAFELLHTQTRVELAVSSDDGATVENMAENPKALGAVFEVVEPTLLVDPPIVQLRPTFDNTEGRKHMADAQPMLDQPRCRVYVVGQHPVTSFALGTQRDKPCEVHVFDCTQRAMHNPGIKASGKHVMYHHWCVGTDSDTSWLIVKIFRWLLGTEDSALNFRSLTETMADLGHSHVDFIKVDNAGLEWRFLQTEIVDNKQRPPVQLGFKLYTQGSTYGYAQHFHVTGKGYGDVNRLFRSLDASGYRTVSKTLDAKDPGAAEFLLLNIGNQREVSPELRGFWESRSLAA